MTTQHKATQVPAAAISEALEKGVDEADLVRAAGLRGLQRIRAAKVMGLMREHVRLSARLGRDHPRVVALEGKIGGEKLLVQQLVREARWASKGLPARDEHAWLLYGLVHDEDFVLEPNLTIALYDREGVWAASLGYAVTNRYGNFRLESRALGKYSGQSLYLHVLDDVATHLWIDKQAVEPELGVDEYREIVLRKEGEGDLVSIRDGTQPIADRNHWVVRGRIRDQDNRGVAEVTVRLFDEGHAFSERLGQTRTDVDGYYLLSYRMEHWEDLVTTGVKLFLEVLDQEEKVLETSGEPLSLQGGHAEVRNLQVVRE